MSETTSLFDRAFANGIAFLLPGLVFLFGIATVNDTVRAWFQGAQNGPTLAGLVFVLVAALALNIAITAVRWLLFEHMTFGIFGCPWVKAAPKLDLSKRKDLEAQYVDLRHQYYYHYLAYANTAVAVPLGLFTWIVFATPVPNIWQGVFVCSVGLFITIALGKAGCEAARRYDERRTMMLGLLPDVRSVADPPTAPVATS
jgi:hypothetical protein